MTYVGTTDHAFFMQTCIAKACVAHVDEEADAVCDAINLCTPVLDVMAANIQYGVLSFTPSDLRQVCR
jgi:hypothetical protein